MPDGEHTDIIQRLDGLEVRLCSEVHNSAKVMGITAAVVGALLLYSGVQLRLHFQDFDRVLQALPLIQDHTRDLDRRVKALEGRVGALEVQGQQGYQQRSAPVQQQVEVASGL